MSDRSTLQEVAKNLTSRCKNLFCLLVIVQPLLSRHQTFNRKLCCVVCKELIRVLFLVFDAFKIGYKCLLGNLMICRMWCINNFQ